MEYDEETAAALREFYQSVKNRRGHGRSSFWCFGAFALVTGALMAYWFGFTALCILLLGIATGALAGYGFRQWTYSDYAMRVLWSRFAKN